MPLDKRILSHEGLQLGVTHPVFPVRPFHGSTDVPPAGAGMAAVAWFCTEVFTHLGRLPLIF